MPGTSSYATPAAASAASSDEALEKTAGSPPLSRTMVLGPGPWGLGEEGRDSLSSSPMPTGLSQKGGIVWNKTSS